MSQPKLSRGVKVDNQGNLIWMWTSHYPTYITGIDAVGVVRFFATQSEVPERKKPRT